MIIKAGRPSITFTLEVVLFLLLAAHGCSRWIIPSTAATVQLQQTGREGERSIQLKGRKRLINKKKRTMWQSCCFQGAEWSWNLKPTWTRNQVFRFENLQLHDNKGNSSYWVDVWWDCFVNCSEAKNKLWVSSRDFGGDGPRGGTVFTHSH